MGKMSTFPQYHIIKECELSMYYSNFVSLSPFLMQSGIIDISFFFSSTKLYKVQVQCSSIGQTTCSKAPQDTL